MSVKQTVVAAVTKLFSEKDAGAVKEYFGPEYIQHSTIASDGIEGLTYLAENPPPKFEYEILRVISEEDLVLVHGLYTGIVDHQLVAFDVYRVSDGRVIEHWDSLTPRLPAEYKGRSQIGGPVEPVDLEKSSDNKTLVLEFTEKILIGADPSELLHYVSADSYTEHNLETPDGIEGLRATILKRAAEGTDYIQVHQVIAEGNFVFIRAEGYDDRPLMLNDLWRVENGKIVEHWHISESIPEEMPHANGAF